MSGSVSGAPGATATGVAGRAGLPERLRGETAELHHRVEDRLDLPTAVGTTAEYAALLRRFRSLHTALERRLSDPRWSDRWAELGVRPGDHCRAHLAAADLAELGGDHDVERARGCGADVVTVGEDVERSLPATFEASLGALYVLEGSALGGRVLAPAFRARLGDVPTAFFGSGGRDQPRLWRAVRHALRRFDEQGGDGDAVVGCAGATFELFERHVCPPQGGTGA